MSSTTTSNALHPAISWDDFAQAFEGIFERQYYTENGPLVRQLEARLSQHTQAKHVVSVMNEFVAYLVLLDSLPRGGEVLVPLKSPVGLQQALGWLPQLTPVGYDHPKDVTALLTPMTCAVVGASGQWPQTAASDIQTQLHATDRIPLILDCSHDPLRPLAHCDVHICSMHASYPLGAMEGAYVALSDDDWADSMRTMRSSSGAPRTMSVKKTVNGRLSEAHAALALLQLEYGLVS